MTSDVSSLTDRAAVLRDVANDAAELAAFAKVQGWVCAPFLERLAKSAKQIDQIATAEASAALLDVSLPQNPDKLCKPGCRRPPGHSGPCNRLRL